MASEDLEFYRLALLKYAYNTISNKIQGQDIKCTEKELNVLNSLLGDIQNDIENIKYGEDIFSVSQAASIILHNVPKTL